MLGTITYCLIEQGGQPSYPGESYAGINNPDLTLGPTHSRARDTDQASQEQSLSAAGVVLSRHAVCRE
jgi:hypothetical protein